MKLLETMQTHPWYNVLRTGKLRYLETIWSWWHWIKQLKNQDYMEIRKYYHSVQNVSFSTCPTKKDKDTKLETLFYLCSLLARNLVSLSNERTHTGCASGCLRTKFDDCIQYTRWRKLHEEIKNLQVLTQHG